MLQYIIIIIVIIILFLSLAGKPSRESFTFTKGAKHVLMDDWGRVTGMYDYIPYTKGDDTFKKVVCPGAFQKQGVMCWSGKFEPNVPFIDKPYTENDSDAQYVEGTKRTLSSVQDLFCDESTEGWHKMNSTMYPKRKLRHAVQSAHGGIAYVSDKPPCRRGDYSCWRIPCKNHHEYDLMCWACQLGYHKPQDE